MNELFFEGKMLRLDQMFKRGDLDSRTFIVFDTETTGLFNYERGSRNNTVKQVLSPSVKKSLMEYFTKDAENNKAEAIAIDKKTALFKNENTRRNEFDAKTKQRYASKKVSEIEKKIDTFVQLTEIAAVAIDVKGNHKGKFHEYVKFDKNKVTDSILKLIHWGDEKDVNSEQIKIVLQKFFMFIKKYDNPILLAHNAAFDAALITRLAKFHGLKDLFNLMKTITIVDSRRNTKLREVLKDVLPYKTFATGKGKTGTRTIEDNKQASIIKALNITNDAAHTAIEDVNALSKAVLKLFDLYTKAKSPV